MIDKVKIKEEISNGKIFSASFVKVDGTNRSMVARVGVQKGVKGVGRKFDPEDKGLVSVFDMQKRQFRFINLNTTYHVRANGRDYN